MCSEFMQCRCAKAETSVETMLCQAHCIYQAHSFVISYVNAQRDVIVRDQDTKGVVRLNKFHDDPGEE